MQKQAYICVAQGGRGETAMALSAMDDRGNPVDWWFMYKIAGKSKTSKGTAAGAGVGTEYVYFDANAPASAKLTLSADRVDKNGALPNTLNQLYGTQGAAAAQLGWFFYNDENPINGKVNGSRGHTKGVLAFDLSSDTAFWLVQSTPLFPPAKKYAFPTTGEPNAQTLLCVTLQNASVVSLAIARQMVAAQQPNVYLQSTMPAGLAANDPRALLMQNQVAPGNTPIAGTVPFNSKGGLKFMSMAKNKYWDLDFYNDWVGPALHDNLDVETWEHGKTPLPLDSDKIHTVVDMKGIDLNPLGIDMTWPEPDDHAKLAISARSETDHFVCVGDINFTITMRTRSGGTVAFKNEALWSSLSSILVGVTTHLKPGSKAAKLAAMRKAMRAKAGPRNGATKK
jgi:deoxyribonuclease-2